MNKYFALILACLSGTVSMYANNGPHGEFAEWGKVTMDELKMTECKFEKNARAMLLLDLGEYYYDSIDNKAFKKFQFRISSSYYQRYKVFSERGTDKANRRILINLRNKETVTNIRAICYQLVNGQIKKTVLDSSNIHTLSTSEAQREILFTVPGVLAGCVFEVGYDKKQEASYKLPDWYFSGDVPCDTSRLTVGFLKSIAFYENMHEDSNVLISVTAKEFSSDVKVPYSTDYKWNYLEGDARTFTCTHVPSHKEEPYTNTMLNYTTWIGFQIKHLRPPFSGDFMHTFNEVGDYLWSSKYFEDNRAEGPIPQSLEKSLVHCKTSEEKVISIYNFVSHQVEWNNEWGLTPTSTNYKVWANKKGSWADISFLLIYILRSQGINAYPMLVGSRSNNTMSREYPVLDDYIGVDVIVALDNNRNIILDPTQKHLPFGDAGLHQLNTFGLVFRDKNDCYWYNIVDQVDNKETVDIDVVLDGSDKIRGTAKISYINHSAGELLNAKRSDDIEKLSTSLRKEIPNVVIESVRDTMVGNSYTCFVGYSTQAVMDNESNLYIPISAIYGELSNPFSDKDRVTDIDFVYKRKVSVNMTIHLSNVYVLDSLPAQHYFTLKDTSATFTESAEFSGTDLVIHQQLEYKKSLYKAADFPSFYDFQKKYYDLRQKPVMLRKKS